MKTLVASLLAAAIYSPAFAGPQFCSDEADTYYIEQVPDGFAVVRASYSDICRKKAEKYVCNDDPAYTMNFIPAGDDLDVTFPDGGTSRFEACVFER